MSKLNETYFVPGEVMIATSTGRTQFIDTLINNIKGGTPLPVEQQAELLRMVKDLIEDRHKQQTHFNEMKNLIRLFRDFANGIDKKAEELRNLIIKAEDVGDQEEASKHESDAPA